MSLHKNIYTLNYKIYLLVAMSAIIAFLPFILLNNGIMIFHGDSYEQIYKMWIGFYNLIKDGTLSQFNWSVGFGTNIFSLGYYLLFDPMLYISLLFPKEFIPYFILVSVVCLIIIGYILSHFWLYECTKNEKASHLGAFVIAFSGYVFILLQYYQFHKFLLFYPLILFLVERYLKKNKFGMLSIVIGLLGISNYYLLYQFIPFLLLYTLMRYISINSTVLSFKRIILDAGKFLLIVILGIAISSFVLLPSLYLIMKMPRFSVETFSFFDHMSITQLFEIISNLFTPALDRYDANYFVNVANHSSLGWSGGVSIYCLAITPLFLPLVFKLKSKVEKSLLLVFYGLLGIFIYFQGFSYLFQMNMETRWLYMIVFLNAYMVTTVYADKTIKKNNYLYSSILIICLILLSFIVTVVFRLNNAANINKLFYIVLFAIIFTILFSFVLYKEYNFRYLVALLSINAIISGWAFYKENKPIENHFVTDQINFDSSMTKIDDSSFYRTLYDISVKNEFYLTSSNEPFSHGYKGASFYSSVYNAEQELFLNRFKSTWNMPQAQGKTQIYNLLSSKYWYTYQHNHDVPYGYEFLEEKENGLQIYQNSYFVELGFVYDKTINAEAIKNLGYFEQDRIMQSYIITENSDNYSYQLHDGIIKIATLPTDTVRVYDFDVPICDESVFIETFGIPNVKVELYNGSQLVNNYDFWQFNYVDFYVKEPITRLVIKGEDVYGSGTEINLYVQRDMEQVKENFKNLTLNSLQDVVVSKDYLSARIKLDKSGYLFTSIPFDLGWEVIVDGKKQQYEKVNLGFIGFSIDEGIHELKFTYTIPYMKMGCSISLLALSILGLLIGGKRVLSKRNQKRKSFCLEKD